ncbi:MAG: tetratricopeptide repeat protein [Terracoccus sp.]
MPFALRLSWAQGLFERGDHAAAATALSGLVADVEAQESLRPDGGEPVELDELPETMPLHGTAELRLLLARAYFHSAQLGRAEAVLVRLVEEEPTDAYAHLLLGRTLQRAGRREEAARPLALAEILGGYERHDAPGT